MNLHTKTWWRLIAFAVTANALIIVVCFALLGWNQEGAGAATRNTARFAITFFLAGFAAPGARRWFDWWPEPALLLQTFVAAQFVHFTAVVLLHTTFSPHRLQLGTGQVIIVILGFSIVAGLGATAPMKPVHGLRRVMHLLMVYLVFLILAADYSQHPVKLLRWMMLPIILALVLRHLPRNRSKRQNSLEAVAG
jgi:hypothetical protein